jgi:hypothetical protein
LEEQARLIGISSLISKSEPVAALIGKARNLLSAPASSSPFEVFRG